MWKKKTDILEDVTIETPAGLSAQKNDPTFNNVWQELKWRGLVQVSTDEAELEKLLAGDSITYYCGFDPTAPSLHQIGRAHV